VGAWRKALAFEPLFAGAWTYLGIVLHAQKDLPGAVGAHRKALAIDPQSAEARNNLGNALYEQKDLPGAVGAYRKALAIDPQYAPAWNNLGNALYAQKDLTGAVGACRKALAIDPQYAPAWNNLGNALYEQKDLPGAGAAYKKALAIDPQYAAAWNNLGGVLYAQKELPGAVRAYKKALTIDPRYAAAWNNLGLALHHQKQWPGAVSAYRKALAIDPQNAEAWYNLGNALRDQKDPPGAVGAYRNALKIDPNYPEANCNLGFALGQQGCFTEALNFLKEGHRLGSQRPGWPYPSASWVQDCRQLLKQEQRAQAISMGEVEAATATEPLQLAQFCRKFDRPHTAARLYAAAFAAQPSLADDLGKGHRYQAACAAALAAAGQGHDASKLSDRDRTALRRQALDWLRADLKRLTQTVANHHAASAAQKPPPASPLEKLAGQSQRPGAAALLLVCDRLQQWQNSLDLHSVRDDKELARLTPEEQKDWRQLWHNVRALHQKARACFTERRLSGNLTDQQKEQTHKVPLQAGKTYIFDLESTAFDAMLRLLDAEGKKLAENDDIDPGVNLNSRIVYPSPLDGTYRLVVTTCQGRGTGGYTLTIREFSSRPK
jgi:tetratricopeptide (TPR) repeat protein